MFLNMLVNRISLLRTDRFELFIHVPLIWQGVVISWTLATGIFPYYYKYLSEFTYWWMGVAGVGTLIFSVFTHELIRIYFLSKLEITIRDLTLFLFGGVTEYHLRRAQEKEELLAALSGPLIYLCLAVAVHFVLVICRTQALAVEITGLVEFTRIINVVLGVINIFPLLPLDGGKVVQFFLSMFFVNTRKAVAFLSEITTVAALLIITAGIFVSLKGYFQGGLWWIIFGMYLMEGGSLFRRRFIIQEIMQMETADTVMNRNPVSVHPQLSITRFIHDYLYRFHYKIFPVLNYDQKIQGVLFSKNVFDLSKQEWADFSVADVANVQLSEVTVYPDTDILSVISKMHRTGQSRIVVIDREKQLKGIIVLKDIVKYISEKMKL